MGVTALFSNMSAPQFDAFMQANLYTTMAYIQDDPLLKTISVYSDLNLMVSIERVWRIVDLLFSDKGAPLKYIIEGDYHHPAGIDNGIDPGGYLYEGFVTPKRVKAISALLADYPRETIIDELKKHNLIYGIDYVEKQLELCQNLFTFYQEVAARGDAIAILLS